MKLSSLSEIWNGKIPEIFWNCQLYFCNQVWIVASSCELPAPKRSSPGPKLSQFITSFRTLPIIETSWLLNPAQSSSNHLLNLQATDGSWLVCLYMLGYSCFTHIGWRLVYIGPSCKNRLAWENKANIFVWLLHIFCSVAIKFSCEFLRIPASVGIFLLTSQARFGQSEMHLFYTFLFLGYGMLWCVTVIVLTRTNIVFQYLAMRNLCVCEGDWRCVKHHCKRCNMLNLLMSKFDNVSFLSWLPLVSYILSSNALMLFLCLTVQCSKQLIQHDSIVYNSVVSLYLQGCVILIHCLLMLIKLNKSTCLNNFEYLAKVARL